MRIFKNRFAVTPFNWSSTEYSRSVCVNTMSGFLNVKDGPPIIYGFVATCNDSAAFGNCVKFLG